MLDRLLGCELFIKAESLQKTASFKFRGALNRLMQLSPAQLERGVVAYSSGNHGHGVAAAASVIGTSAVIVLPKGASPVKVESCRWWGAKILTYDPDLVNREDVARDYLERHGMTLIPPFDDYAIIAGQGMVGLELCEQMISLGKAPDIVVIPCSGGGLSSGVTTSVREFFPQSECIVSEPAGYDKMSRSLKLGSRTSNEHEAKTIMDALIGKLVGEKTFEILKRQKVKAVSVSDADSIAGTFAAFRYLRLVLEPGGAAALAAVLTGKIDLAGKCVAVVCSGGNIDSATLAKILTGELRGSVTFT